MQANSKTSSTTLDALIGSFIGGGIGFLLGNSQLGAAIGGCAGVRVGIKNVIYHVMNKEGQGEIQEYFGLREAMNVFQIGENELNRRTLQVVYRSKKSYYSKFSNLPFYQKKLEILEKAYALLSQKLQ